MSYSEANLLAVCVVVFSLNVEVPTVRLILNCCTEASS